MTKQQKLNRSNCYEPMDALLLRLGQTVRAARTSRNMPRRVLSEASGVSPRYLAQLETGKGNISITLLWRVAQALDLQLVDLLGDAHSHEEALLLSLYRRTDGPTRGAVLRRLEAAAEVPDRGQRICLIGLRGAGKSTLGRSVGERLGVPFVELNSDIEQQGGMPISEILALYGIEGYRQLEAAAVRRMAARHDRLILAAAGGIVSAPDTYATLSARFHTVWIEAAPEDHMNRVRAQGDDRPMQGRPEAMSQLRAILDTRTEAYSKADARLNTSGQTVDASAKALERLILEHGFLD